MIRRFEITPMIGRAGLVCAILILLGCFAVVDVQAQRESGHPAGQASDAGSGINALGDALLDLGYIEIPLERAITGHLFVNVWVDDRHELRMVCDSGSGGTLVLPAAAKRLSSEQEETDVMAGGVGGGNLSVSSIVVDKLKIGSFEERDVPLLVVDVSHVNQQFESVGVEAIDGIIGSDWMAEKHALIDIAGSRMFIAEP